MPSKLSSEVNEIDITMITKGKKKQLKVKYY